MAKYEPTSERVSEDDIRASTWRYLIYLFHVATYEFAERYTAGSRVLDMGCGTGYGTHVMAATASRVVGVDVAEDAIAFARDRYSAPNLEYRRIAPVEQERLPFGDDEFDVVTSFQVIEHVPDVAAYLAEIRRVLAPTGSFVCATPDRTTRLFRRQRPWNVYHLDEFTPDGLRDLLQRTFEDVDVMTMSARPDLLATELRRCRRLRLATLPFTFPGAPEAWRRAGLVGLARLEGLVARRRDGVVEDFDYGPEVVQIAPGAEPSVNIVAVAG
jgi:SAM-dependent methyltransferase